MAECQGLVYYLSMEYLYLYCTNAGDEGKAITQTCIQCIIFLLSKTQSGPGAKIGYQLKKIPVLVIWMHDMYGKYCTWLYSMCFMKRQTDMAGRDEASAVNLLISGSRVIMYRPLCCDEGLVRAVLAIYGQANLRLQLRLFRLIVQERDIWRCPGSCPRRGWG